MVRDQMKEKIKLRVSLIPSLRGYSYMSFNWWVSCKFLSQAIPF